MDGPMQREGAKIFRSITQIEVWGYRDRETIFQKLFHKIRPTKDCFIYSFHTRLLKIKLSFKKMEGKTLHSVMFYCGGEVPM